MLQDIRKNSQGTVAKVIVWLIAITFALFGVESIVGGLSGEAEIATVNGEDISESDYLRALEIKRRQILAQMGEAADPDLLDDDLLKKSVLDGLVEQEVLRQDADNKGLFISDQAVDSYIADTDQFKIDGVFSNDRLQSLLRGAGLTLQSYRDSIRKEFLVAQPRTALIATSFLLDNERQELLAIDRQTRSFEELTVSKESYLESVVVNDEEVQAYYEENKDSFVKPESVDISYLEIKQSDLATSVEVTEEALQQLYESEKELYATDEERAASHILVKIDDSRTEEEALAKTQEIAGKLKDGADFAELAKEFSEDEGSATDGGSLGAAAKGVYVADFENALFALEEGQISEPVKTEFGYHLIKLDEIVDSGLPEMAEVRDQLEVRLKEQNAAQTYAELAERLADISYSAPDLIEPSDELELELKSISAVSSESKDAIFSNPKIQKQLFADDLVNEGNNSELIEIAAGHGVVFRVDSYKEAGVKVFDEVKEEIRELLMANKAQEFASSVGQAFIARVQAGEEAADVASDMGLTWTVHTDIARGAPSLNRELLLNVFALDKGVTGNDSIFGFESVEGDFIVARLNAVKEGDVSKLNEFELKSVTRLLGENTGAQDYRSYREIAEAKAEVEKI